MLLALCVVSSALKTCRRVCDVCVNLRGMRKLARHHLNSSERPVQRHGKALRASLNRSNPCSCRAVLATGSTARKLHRQEAPLCHCSAQLSQSSSMTGTTVQDIKAAVHDILDGADLNSWTASQVVTAAADKLGQDADKKSFKQQVNVRTRLQPRTRPLAFVTRRCNGHASARMYAGFLGLARCLGAGSPSQRRTAHGLASTASTVRL